MLVIELLGTLSLRADVGSVPLVAQQKRPLALLAVLALGGKQGLSRHRIESYLWPESEADRAGHALNQAVYAIRQSLGDDLILSTSQDLRLNQERVNADVWLFDEAIAANDWARAASIYKGSLLDGVHFGEGRELESLIDANRTRLRQDYHNALEYLANASTEAGDRSQSVIWWRTLANSDSLSPHATKKLMLALAAAGDRAGALRQARLYQELVRQELEMEPDSEIEALANRLSRAAAPESAGSKVVPKGANDPVASVRESADSVNNPSTRPSRDTWTTSKKSGTGWERALLFGVISLAVLMTGAAILGWMRPSSSKSIVRSRLVMDSTEAIAKGSSWSGRIALSSDGKLLAYIGGPRSQLLIRSRDQLHAIALPGTEGVTNPFFSPDGKHVGFLQGEGVRIASIEGGPPITLTQGGPSITVNDTLTGLAGASWGADGMIYADNDGTAGLVRVEAKAGAIPNRFTTLDTANGEIDHTWPDVLPNGKGVLFTVTYSGKKGVKGRFSYAIAVAKIPSGKHRVIVQDATFARYASSGHLLYVTDDKTLMAVPFDQNSMTLTGEPVALTEGIRAGLGGSADLAISATGTLVYSTGAEAGKQELVWVTRQGIAEAVDPDWSGELLSFPAVSPDGKQLAVTRSARGEPFKIWIKRLDRGPSILLAGDGNENFQPAWSPDGRSVAFTSNPTKGSSYVEIERADGGASRAVQFRRTGNLFNAGWSPDGRWLIFETDRPSAGDILAMRPGVDTAPIPLVATTFTETAPTISPNGRWLAYSSNEAGTDDIYVVPFPNTRGGKWPVTTDGGTEPVWSHRGTELFYRDASGDLVAVAVNADGPFAVGRSTTLFPAAGYASMRYTPQYAVSRDDRRFLMIRPLETNAPDNIIVVDNWFEELKSAKALPASRR
ncbi:MAG: BTAD domain-containing putative transcriptional regulator [Gemmatimonadaceae bacterium]